MEKKQEFDEALDNYLRRNGAKEIPVDYKGKLELLKRILSNEKFNLDVIDYEYNKAKEKGEIEPEKYLGDVKNIEINIHNAKCYIGNVYYLVRQERKEKRKQAIKRFFGIKSK